jgi:hypothetical protein
LKSWRGSACGQVRPAFRRADVALPQTQLNSGKINLPQMERQEFSE